MVGDALASIVVFLAAFSMFAAVAGRRPIDGDEGFYLIAARMVASGAEPYTSFFFPQNFLVPYVYAAWGGLFGLSWMSGRALSCILASILAVLMYRSVVRETSNRFIGMATVGLLLLNGLALNWFPVVKTYSISTLTAFGGWYLATSRSQSMRLVPWAAGFLLGVAVDSRLMLAPLVPVLLVTALLRSRRAEPGVWLIAGTACAVAPTALFILHDPRAYLFDNLTYHALRSEYGLVGGMLQKAQVLGNALILPGTYPSAQLFVLVTAGVIAWAWNERARSPLAIAAVVMLTSLLPSPAFGQYNVVAVPFLIVGIVIGISGFAFSRRTGGREGTAEVALARKQRALGWLAFTSVIAYLAGVPTEVASAMRVRVPPEPCSLASVRAVSQQIEVLAPGRDTVVITWWPGYCLETSGRLLPGLENHFGLTAGRRVPDPAARARYRILSDSDIERAIRDRTADLVVAGPCGAFVEKDAAVMDALEREYEVVREAGGATIYARRRPTSGANEQPR